MSKTKKEKEILLKRSYNLFVSSDKEECLELLKQAVQLDPYCHKSYYLLSLLYEETEQELPFLLMSCYLKKNDINLWVKAYSLTQDSLQKVRILNQIYKITDSKTKREILYELLKLYSLLNDTNKIYKTQIKLLKYTGDQLNLLVNELIINIFKGRTGFQKSICLNLTKEIFNYKLRINLENYLNLIYILFKCNFFKLIRKLKKFCGFKIKNNLYNDIIKLTKKVIKKDYECFMSDYTDLTFFYIDFMIHNNKLEEALSLLNSFSDKNILSENVLFLRFFYKENIFRVKILNDLLIYCRNKNLKLEFLIKLRIGCILYEKKDNFSLEIFSKLYSLDPYNKYFKKLLGKEHFFSTTDVYSLVKRFIRNNKRENFLIDRYNCNDLFLEDKSNKLSQQNVFLEVKKTNSNIKKKKLWGIYGKDWFIFLYNFILDCKDYKLIIQILNSNNISVLKREQIIFLSLVVIKISLKEKEFSLFLEGCKKLNKNYHLIYYLLSVFPFNFIDSKFYNTQRSAQKYLKNKLKEEFDDTSELSSVYLCTFLPHYVYKETVEYLLSIYHSNPLLIPILLKMSTGRKVVNKKELINKVFNLVKDDYNLGRVYQFLGLNGKAEEFYKKVDNKFCLFNLAFIYKKSGNLLSYKRMIEKYKKIIKKKKD